MDLDSILDEALEDLNEINIQKAAPAKKVAKTTIARENAADNSLKDMKEIHNLVASGVNNATHQATLAISDGIHTTLYPHNYTRLHYIIVYL